MTLDLNACGQSEQTCAYALGAVTGREGQWIEAHIRNCPDCRRELEDLRPIVERFAAWPIDVLRPLPSLWARVAERIAEDGGGPPRAQSLRTWSEPDWNDVAPGIECKLLAEDTEGNRISMLVRLAPGVSYPPHVHAGVEELHLLDGELWINERKLFPGDYNYGLAGTSDDRVWSETGCTCVLVTSTKDALR